MSELTRWPPALVEPASQTRSAFAAASSDGTIISRRSEPTYEFGDGMPRCSVSTVAAIASFTVDAAGKRAFAFQAAPPPSTRFWTYAAEVPEYRRSSDRSLRARTGSLRDRTSRGRAAAGSP